MNIEELKIANDKGQQLAAWLYKGNEKKKEITVLFHGHPSDSHGTVADLAKNLAEAGLNVLRFDHRGCGESEGEFSEYTSSTAIEDGKKVLEWAKTQNYETINLLGRSFGGNTVLNLALLYDKEIGTLVLHAPAADMTDESEVNMYSSLAEWKKQGYYDQIWQDKKTGEKTVKRIPYQFYLESQEHIMYEPSKNIQTRTLIIHGNEDTLIPLEQSQKLAENMPQALLVVLDGANHKLAIDGDTSECYKLTIEWLSD